MSKDMVILALSCLGIVQALFLSFYLFTLNKGSRRANLFLGLAILGLTIRIGKSVLNVYLDLEPWQRNLGLSGILLTGPSLWFYGKALLLSKKDFLSKDVLHFLPFILFVTFSTVIPNNANPISYVIYILVFSHLAVYVFLSFGLLVGNRTEIRKQLGNWFRNLVIGTALIWLFYMGHLAGLFSFYIGGALFFSLLIYVFSFLFLQKHAFQLGKYNSSTLDKSTSKLLMESLKQLFSEEEIYLDNSLSLESVSERLKVSPRKLSQAINENEEKNFSDFVASHRVEKAKSLLIDPNYRNEKIIAVAYDCGFGNITSFNLAFKAKTKRTPSQYRREFGKV
ncbi:helix-turn-helix domain-containing protein [Flagellimonas meridianipacifica]|uniref:AraC-like DNA-binding protein n=1 Tax=Flagellimonas meridianipacifica TaxID=1080225 RepID=A0A2T0MHL8_9FLAO|nr:helix-turn-helix domain-containing protein [Allomuricauda pacifica]PRX57073.1 AraC-like DNA-binding protein [Allomuricauda pacifica]